MPQPVTNSVVAILHGISSPKLPSQNQSPENSFKSDSFRDTQSAAGVSSNDNIQGNHRGTDKLGLRAVLEQYGNDQWLPDYYDDQQRAEIVLDQFKRQVEQELKLMVLEVDEE